jgi:hypothetical protein
MGFRAYASGIVIRSGSAIMGCQVFTVEKMKRYRGFNK